MANADAVHLMGLRTMEKTKRDVREVFAPFPVDVKQAAAGRAFLKVAGKNSQGANVEEDEENTEITAEKLLEAVAANTKDAKVRQLFEATKSSIKAMRTKQWKKNISATEAEMEKNVASEAHKELPAVLNKMKKLTKGDKDAAITPKGTPAIVSNTAPTSAARPAVIAAKSAATSESQKAMLSASDKSANNRTSTPTSKKKASFAQTAANPTPVVSGDFHAVCDQFEHGLATAKDMGFVNDDQSFLGLLILHQTKQDWSVEQQLNAIRKHVDESPLIGELYKSHRHGEPLASQLAMLMDADRAKDVRQKTPAVARLFLQVAKALPFVK